MQRSAFFPSLLVLTFTFTAALAQEYPAAAPQDTSRGDKMLAEYFRAETTRLQTGCLQEVKTLEDWQAKRETYRNELFEMLGLQPLPQRTPLQASVTRKFAGEGYKVENLHFQSRPGLYVTANLYLPAGNDQKKEREKRAPAVLYVCGHGKVKKEGVSYGNKTHYHHHGVWFARHGFVCLMIDTVQLGEIEGVHHGTYRENRWWWFNRGYTPAGVEAWNCMRALDYLQSRSEVDGDRIGVTGRSGGGAYSWWIAAIDERIKCAVPVAGMTDLQNHVVDGCVEGHCDCMYMVNTYRWDYAKVAALVAPRPLLISNTDRDSIFPLDGVLRTHNKVRRIYELYGAAENCALHITAGTHKDTQELRIHAFRWLNHHLKGDDTLIHQPADQVLKPEQLKVFQQLPADEKNTSIDETFTVAATHKPPADAREWAASRKQWMADLRSRVFGGWPAEPGELNVKQVFSANREGVTLSAYEFTSQKHVDLRLYVSHRAGLEKPALTVLNVLNDGGWKQFLATMSVAFKQELAGEQLPAADAESFAAEKAMYAGEPWVTAYLAPRGVGPTAFDLSSKKQIQHRRRFYLLGQTLEGMQVFDTTRAAAALRSLPAVGSAPLWIQGEGAAAGVALYAGLFTPDVTCIDLHQPPASHRDGPYLLNVSRYLDMPQAVALAAENSRVVVYDQQPAAWKYVRETAGVLKWSDKAFQHRAGTKPQ